MVDYLIFILLIAVPIYASIKGIRTKAKIPKNRSSFYIKDILTHVAIIVLFFLLSPNMFSPLDFNKIGKGISVGSNFYSFAIIIFSFPFLFSFTSWNSLYPKDISTAKEIYGLPIQFYPNSWKEYLFFNIYIIVGVVFEELFCRQFMFYSFNQVLGLQGDYLLLLSSFLFAIAHYYQGWKGILTSLAMGLILGKIFQASGTILFPIILHLISNLTISVLAFRRLMNLCKKPSF